MLHWRPDGLKPHVALWAWLDAAVTVRSCPAGSPPSATATRWSSARSPAPPTGARAATGPAGERPGQVLLRYPARGWQRGRRLHVEQTSDQPLYVGTQVTLRAGEQLVFEAPEPMTLLAARVPRQPITFMYGNLVWGPHSDEVWAVYELEMHSYEGRPRRGKIDLMGDLADAADGLEADFQLLRISRQWSLEDYAAGADATVDARHGHLDRVARGDRRPARPPRWARDRATRGLPRRAVVALGAHARGARRQHHARRAARRLARAQARLRALGPARPEREPARRRACRRARRLSAARRLPRLRAASTATLQWLVCRAFAAVSASPRWTSASSRRRSSSTTTANGASSRSSTTCCGCSSRAITPCRARALAEVPADRLRARRELAGVPDLRRARRHHRVPRSERRAAVRTARGTRLPRRRRVQRAVHQQREGGRDGPPRARARRQHLRRGEPRRPRP